MDSKRALQIEKIIAKFLNWKRVAFSGGKWFDKEDIRSEKYLAQVKATEQYAIKVDSRDIRKLEDNALKYRKKPIFIIHFDTSTPLNSTWCMMPIKYFKKIKEDETYED
ncbi:MAG: hypothetical protein WC934_13635 [Acidithiobacillus sp.]|jgi:hypothetical protein|uniref:hypothetical protein n=1 Tax=Acidithiobacillus sp. TaxID=1872118 RepID=UPI00356112F2